MQDFISGNSVVGQVQLCRIGETGYRFDQTNWCNNLVLYDWAPVVAHALRNSPNGKANYIGAMYIEFDNSGSSVTAPSYGREIATSYYANLNSADPNQDYLRVAVDATSGSNSDAIKFSENNVSTFRAQTSGVTGVHGNTFSDAVSSRVYGVALVACREGFANSSGDLVFARYYFATAQQKVKQAGDQIGVGWAVTFN